MRLKVSCIFPDLFKLNSELKFRRRKTSKNIVRGNGKNATRERTIDEETGALPIRASLGGQSSRSIE